MSGLNLNCTIHYNKWDKYVVLFAQNNPAVILRVPFKNEVVAFVNDMVVNVENVAQRANFDLDGMTNTKQLSKQAAAEAFGQITSNAKSFAISKNLTTLIAQMNNASSSKLFREKDENFVSRCNSLNDTLTDVITAYPVDAIAFFTATDLAAALLKSADFENKLGTWAVAETDKNNAKIEFEFQWMPKMNDALVFLEGMLPGAIKATFPAFAAAFISLKKLIKVGVRDQGILPTIEDSVSGALLVNMAKMETLNYTGTQNQKVQLTGPLGLFKLMKLKIGVWQIRFSAPGYIDQIITVKIESKKVLRPLIKLVPVV